MHSRLRWSRLMLVVVSIGAWTLILPGQVLAVPLNPSAPALGVVVGVSTPVGIGRASSATAVPGAESGANTAAATSPCWYVDPYEYIDGITGNNLAHFYLYMYWCGNGHTITSHQTAQPTGTVQAAGWSYKGIIGHSNAGGTGGTYWQEYYQGSFCLISYFGCVQNWYPWLRLTAYPNGTYALSDG